MHSKEPYEINGVRPTHAQPTRNGSDVCATGRVTVTCRDALLCLARTLVRAGGADDLRRALVFRNMGARAESAVRCRS
jgi:hypothetical protein